MRQGLDKYSYRNGTIIKHKKGDFQVPELRFPNFRIRDFELQEYSYIMLYVIILTLYPLLFNTILLFPRGKQT